MENIVDKIITNTSYNDYLKGKITFDVLSLELGIPYNKLKYTFSKYNIKNRYTFLNENTVHDFFDVIDSEIKAYLLGFFFADGTIVKNHITISLTDSDSEIINLFQKHICPEYKITNIKSYTNKKTGYTSKPLKSITFKSEHMCKTLSNYGICDNKTYKTLERIDFIPSEFFLHFLRGYWDGDGCSCVSEVKRKYIKKDGTLTYSTYFNYNWNIISYTSSHLILIQKHLKEQYNIFANLLTTKKGHYLLEVNRKNDYFLLRDKLYENAEFYLKRKKDKIYGNTVLI